MSGSALDWVTAVSSAVSAVGVITAVVLLRPQLRELRSSAHDRERAIARRVSAWAEKRDDEGRRIVAHNGSELPVWDLRLWLISGVPPDEETEPPWDRSPAARRAVLAPHDDLRHLIPAASLSPQHATTRPAVEIVFRDESDAWWWRDARGRLIRLTPRHMRGQSGPP
jgi:hypothetical protein